MRPPVFAGVELGGSGVQTVVFSGSGWRFADGVDVPPGAVVGLAVPGHVEDGRIASASTFGWTDVDPVEALGLPGPPAVVCNDAEAAALGEWVLRQETDGDLVFVGCGTGVGGAVVRRGSITHGNLFGHQGGFGGRRCACGRIGCLETVAGGWALPAHLDRAAVGAAGRAVARAIVAEPAARHGVIVVGGGLARHHPVLVSRIAEALPERTVVASRAPRGAKSAAAWGLRMLVDQQRSAETT